ncbi:MAG: hypothetical protein QNJ51_09095 [Calothrix sp. MO_167.B12]|nr:hypothetical protein [Calothrix sp. MO_167.B12]
MRSTYKSNHKLTLHKHLHRATALILLLAILTTGCRSTAKYKKLAEIGNQYTDALNELLIEAVEIRVKTSSEQFLRNDRDYQKYARTVTETEYRTISDKDETRLQILYSIQKHNQLLKAYFNKLGELASSGAPGQAKKEVEDIVENINGISQKLQKSKLIKDKNIWSEVPKLIISSKIRGALREEIEKRGQTIMFELMLQEELLKALSNSIVADIKIIKSLQEKRFVIEPLAQPELISDEDTWISKRMEIMKMEIKSAKLKTASEKLGDVKNIFQGFVEGNLSREQINRFQNGIKEILVTRNKENS